MTRAASLNHIPLFIRAGSILPMGPTVTYAAEKPPDPIELRVYEGADAAFELYEDEGDSYRYEEGIHATISMRWDDASRILTIGAREGSFPGMLMERTFHIVWVRPDVGTGADPVSKADAVVTYDGGEVAVRKPSDER